MLRTGATVTPAEILAHLDRSGLSRYDMPEYFLKLDEIPLTASGKILKRDIALQIAGGAVVPAPIRFKPAEKAASA
jgi:acyl-CoA synthetase